MNAVEERKGHGIRFVDWRPSILNQPRCPAPAVFVRHDPIKVSRWFCRSGRLERQGIAERSVSATHSWTSESLEGESVRSCLILPQCSGERTTDQLTKAPHEYRAYPHSLQTIIERWRIRPSEERAEDLPQNRFGTRAHRIAGYQERVAYPCKSPPDSTGARN